MTSSNPTELIIIGTLHGRHNTAKKYTAEALREVFCALRPHRFCVEAESQHIGDDGYVKPMPDAIRESLRVRMPEGAALDDVSRQLGIKLIAFDREGLSQFYRETRYFEREKRAYAELERLASSDPTCVECKIAEMLIRAEECQLLLDQTAGPEVINSEAFDNVIRIKHSLPETLLPLLTNCAEWEQMVADMRFLWDEWDERNTIMADNLTRICSEHPGKRLVALTGGEHRYALRDRLAGRPGIVLKEFWEVLGDVANDNQAADD